jgi:glycosyltransferase involved in cell wall biosynthesis
MPVKEKKMESNQKKSFIIIPGLNEEQQIGNVISRTKKEGFKNIVFVDDGSQDGSALAAKKAGAIVLKHVINLGKGAAAKTGCDYALKNGANIIVLMDADGQHRPEEIKKLVNALKGKDIVFGYRRLNNKMPAVMRIGNWGINKASEVINGIRISDTQSGFRCMTSEAYKKIRWRSNNYSMESEMIANAARQKLKYEEVPIDTIYHDNYKGTTVIDGVKIFFNMLKFRVQK